MKTNQLVKSTFFILSLLIVLFVTSCSGDDGPMGSEGKQGAKGEQGPIGIPGKDGAVIHNGNGAPSASLGKAGDMYLDKSNSNFYGPKSSSEWGTPLNLQGHQGDKGDIGEPGSKIFSGTENPTKSIGIDGDYYLNTTTGDFYGPKTSVGWGSSINLKGTANVVASTWLDYDWHPILSSEKYKTMHYVYPKPFLNAVGYTDFKSFSDAGGIILIYGKHDYSYASGGLRLFDYSLKNIKCSANPQIIENHNVDLYISFLSLNDQPIHENAYSSAKKQNQFRYVLIPAGIQLTATGTSATTRSASDINWTKLSYEEVIEMLKLED